LHFFVLLLLGVLFVAPPSSAWAASCCGGGSSTSFILPIDAPLMVGLAMDQETYDGLWRSDGTWVPDPEGSDLKQYRLNAGIAYRLADHWQGSLIVPYVWNQNDYSSISSSTSGLGDTKLTLWYETFDNAMCVYRVRELRDLIPAVYLGGTLTIPTGISPYDDVTDNFDITGRGFYRLDFNFLADKTVYPWTGNIRFTYGRYLERSVNSEYGTYVEPYQKQLGDRSNFSLTGGYIYFTEKLHELTMTIGYNNLHESETEIDGVKDETSGFRKQSITLGLVWSTPQKNWIAKINWNHAINADDWGYNFPTTEIISIGVQHVFL
jgi:hypothetical protein